MFNYKEWYEKTKPKRHVWQRQYYQKNREHVLEMHKNWAKRNVDQAGSVWRKYGRWSRIRNPNIDKEYYAQHREEILKKKHDKYQRKKDQLMDETLPNPPKNNNQSSITYNLVYWGPILFKIKLQSPDLKECTSLCSKKGSPINETLAGVIKHEHYISPSQYNKIITPYLGNPFRQAYSHWYGMPFTKNVIMTKAWVNFMVAGEFNPPHIHKNCDFSSVLFIKVPEQLKEERKKFEGTGAGPGSISFTYGEAQPYSLNYTSFFPEEGDLYIFPATLTHFVSPFISEGERISIGANFNLE